MYAYVTTEDYYKQGASPSISLLNGQNFGLASFTPKKNENVVACVNNDEDYTYMDATIAIVSPHHPREGLQLIRICQGTLY